MCCLKLCSCMERPCVTCNVTGCKEIVQDNYNGFLCEPKNADSLYHAMKKMMLLTPERRSEMGKLGRQKMIREFDKQIVIDAYHTAIDEVMAEIVFEKNRAFERAFHCNPPENHIGGIFITIANATAIGF